MQCCGNCEYNCFESVNGRGRFYCGNEKSDMAGNLTDYSDTCDEWEERQ